MRKLFYGLTAKNIALNLVGSAILAFGLFNVHSFSSVTEGGVLGLTLFLDHWLDISPAISGLVLNALCYLIGWRTLGRDFLMYSAIAGGGFSVFYALFEIMGPVYPEIGRYPLAAALVGAVFVGVGVGLSVRAGGAPGGDDALGMSISKMTGVGIQWVYLISDLAVLGLSLTYIPVRRIIYSLVTVIISGQMVGFVQNFRSKPRPDA